MVSPDLLAYVREVAEELVADLEAGARQTKNWGDLRPAKKLVAAALDKCLGSLTVLDLWGKANQIPSSELWNVAGPLLERGRLQHHARKKPRGYAGDDEMLTLIYERAITSDALGRWFDEYFQNLDAPEAVRGRIRLAADALSAAAGRSQADRFRIALLGSGPAIELQLALEKWPTTAPPAEATLLDLDQTALDRARERLSGRIPESQLHTVRENLFRLPRQADKAALLADHDFVICLGFMDYLEDGDAQTLIEWIWNSLRPGGELLVGNFSPDCRARAYMEWIGGWHLIFRTREQLAQLARAAGIPASALTIQAESTGVDLMLHATK